MFRKAIEGSVLWQASQENQFLADLPYLAPEQVTPDAFVDDLCDIYSLGVVLYALATGRLPFRGKTPEEALEQIREDVPQKPKKFERSIPTAFQEIVLKMLAKRQEDRYARPEELLADLNRLAEQRNVTV
jgi:serine/threonine protein kinase